MRAGLAASAHVDAVLGREDTRAQARAWLVTHLPARAGVVVEPFVPADWLSRPPLGDLRLRRYPVQRPFQGYEKRLRVSRIERYRRGGFCWVVVGSHQKDRGLKAGLRNAPRYYRALDAASASVVRFSPYARGAGPVPFSFDKSFDYEPRAFARPGPVVEIHRLRGSSPARPDGRTAAAMVAAHRGRPAARLRMSVTNPSPPRATRPGAGHAGAGAGPGLVGRLDALLSPLALRLLLGAGALAAVVVFVVRRTTPNYDSYYALVWGQEILHGHLPDYAVIRPAHAASAVDGRRGAARALRDRGRPHPRAALPARPSSPSWPSSFVFVRRLLGPVSRSWPWP